MMKSPNLRILAMGLGLLAGRRWPVRPTTA